jgi:membrane associated rhomboid family serine protease
MLDDRTYMRQPSFRSGRSAVVVLLIVNVLAFLVEIYFYGFQPRFGPNDYFALSLDGLRRGYIWQLLTFQFMHAGVLHLLLNCWGIYMFGAELEDTLGRSRFLGLYFGSGVVGGLVQTLSGLLFPAFAAPVVGASAGLFGLVAAFATLYPERRLTLLIFFIIPVSMRAKFLLLFEAIITVYGLLSPSSNVAHAAHLGGMLSGLVFVRYILHGNWHLPRLRRTSRPAPRRLVQVSSGSSAAWRSAQGSPLEDLPPEEFLAKEVDPILDKISACGIQSLTEREKRILEAARTKMAKR